jgi:hypothetical protein
MHSDRKRTSSITLDDPENGWSNDIEEVLDSIRNNACVMSEYHKKNYNYYKNQLKYYKIPVIIISGVNSVIAVGLQPYLDQGLISVSNCLLALLCGIIGSIELFLGISSGAESELKASKDFYILSIDIYKTLTLDRQRRPLAKEFLDHKYSEYSDLFKSSALIQSSKISDKLADVNLVCGSKPAKTITQVPLNNEIQPSNIEMVAHSKRKINKAATITTLMVEDTTQSEEEPIIDDNIEDETFSRNV